jgi:hypothetical protein
MGVDHTAWIRFGVSFDEDELLEGIRLALQERHQKSKKPVTETDVPEPQSDLIFVSRYKETKCYQGCEKCPRYPSKELKGFIIEPAPDDPTEPPQKRPRTIEDVDWDGQHKEWVTERVVRYGDRHLTMLARHYGKTDSLTHLLRDELGFAGVEVGDCIDPYSGEDNGLRIVYAKDLGAYWSFGPCEIQPERMMVTQGHIDAIKNVCKVLGLEGVGEPKWYGRAYLS